MGNVQHGVVVAPLRSGGCDISLMNFAVGDT